jgi:hypothetical protein
MSGGYRLPVAEVTVRAAWLSERTHLVGHNSTMAERTLFALRKLFEAGPRGDL